MNTVNQTARGLLVTLALLVASALSTSASLTGTPAAAIPEPLPLDWCVEMANERNPDIAADAAGAEAAAHRIRPAGSLEDPRAGYTAVNIPVGEWNFSSTPMSGNQFDLRQKLPFPGLLSSRKAAARAGAEAAAETLADRRRTVAAAAERRWAALAFAQRALHITDANPKQNAWKSLKAVPAHTRVSDAMSKDLKRRGFAFVGPTICYAFMQATGMVNDHLVSCFRYRQLRSD